MPHDEPGNMDSPIQLCGDDLLSIAFDTPIACQSIAEQLRRAGGWLESVAGISSVVVRYDVATISPDAALDRLQQQLRSLSTRESIESTMVEVPVCYGGDFGEDLAVLCQTLGLSADELIQLHTSGEYAVDMLGFTPGFAYIGGLPEALSVPRLAQPRLRVAAGSVGIADGRTGLYAMPGPGGWPLIGRTPIQLFEPHSSRPFLLRAGMRVRFKAIDVEAFQKLESK